MVCVLFCNCLIVIYSQGIITSRSVGIHVPFPFLLSRAGSFAESQKGGWGIFFSSRSFQSGLYYLTYIKLISLCMRKLSTQHNIQESWRTTSNAKIQTAEVKVISGIFPPDALTRSPIQMDLYQAQQFWYSRLRMPEFFLYCWLHLYIPV